MIYRGGRQEGDSQPTWRTYAWSDPTPG